MNQRVDPELKKAASQQRVVGVNHNAATRSQTEIGCKRARFAAVPSTHQKPDIGIVRERPANASAKKSVTAEDEGRMQ
jgi:hypothetical protein